MDSIDRRTRGAAHGPDHEVMQRAVAAGRVRHVHRLRLRVRRAGRRGRRCSRPPTGGPPTRLLWEALASTHAARPTSATSPPANEWAIDVGMAARLDLQQEGYLALRDMKPPAPYLHHGTFL